MDDPVDVRLSLLSPDKAYVRSMLWLPKNAVRRSTVQEALQYWTVEKKGKKSVPVLNKLWDETPDHIIVPREFLTTESYLNYPFPFVDLSPSRFPRVDFPDLIKPEREGQPEAWEALRESRGGILNLACGKGKTVLALKKIAAMKMPAMVVVNDGLQIDQWTREIETHLRMSRDDIGFFQGDRRDWKKPITVAMINTLALAARDGGIPDEMEDWFGCVFFDEIQHLAARLFVQCAPVVLGMRFGLTATPERLDELHWVYNYHVGEVFYSDLTQELTPSVYFQQTPIWIDLTSDEARDKAGNVNISRLRTFLATDKDSLQFRYNGIKEAADAGRKILAISHSTEMLKALHEMFPGSGLVTGATKFEDRLDTVRDSRLCFAIAKLGKEALDDPALDALHILTPFSSHNDLQQMLGRIQRAYENKKPPVAVIYDDYQIPPLHYLNRRLQKTLKGWSIPYQTLAVPTF